MLSLKHIAGNRPIGLVHNSATTNINRIDIKYQTTTRPTSSLLSSIIGRESKGMVIVEDSQYDINCDIRLNRPKIYCQWNIGDMQAAKDECIGEKKVSVAKAARSYHVMFSYVHCQLIYHRS